VPGFSASIAWDGPAQKPVTVEGGDGEWNLSNLNWVLAGSPTPFNQAYRGGDQVTFGGSPGVVTVTSDLDGANAANAMQFSTGSYVFNLTPGNDLRVSHGISVGGGGGGGAPPQLTLNAGEQTMSVAGQTFGSGLHVRVNSGTLQLEYPSNNLPLGNGTRVDLAGGSLRLLFDSGPPDSPHPSSGIFALGISGTSALHVGRLAQDDVTGQILNGTGGFDIAAGSKLNLSSDHDYILRSHIIRVLGDAVVHLADSSWQIGIDSATRTCLITLPSTLKFEGSGLMQIGIHSPGVVTDIIQGAGKIVVDGGPGLEVRLGSQNTFAGGVTLSNGRLSLLESALSHSQGPLGGGTLLITGGEIGSGPVVSASPLFVRNRVTIAGDFTIANAGFSELVFTDPVTLQGGVEREIVVEGPENFDTSILGAIDGKLGSGLIKSGSAQLTLGGADDNTYAGNTIVREGVLSLDKAALAIPGDLVIGNGMIESSGTVRLGLNLSEQIADDARVTFAGGRLEFADSEETMGILTLAVSSVLDFGFSTSTAEFSAFERSGQDILQIDHWSGASSGGGADQLRFTSLDSTHLDAFHFAGYPPGGIALPFGTHVEVVPVPEPGFCPALLLGLTILRSRRRSSINLR
jgi:fibronectin-binding autotransporter adhesin